jgi:hypothetical protein
MIAKLRAKLPGMNSWLIWLGFLGLLLAIGLTWFPGVCGSRLTCRPSR